MTKLTVGDKFKLTKGDQELDCRVTGVKSQGKLFKLSSDVVFRAKDQLDAFNKLRLHFETLCGRISKPLLPLVSGGIMVTGTTEPESREVEANLSRCWYRQFLGLGPLDETADGILRGALKEIERLGLGEVENVEATWRHVAALGDPPKAILRDVIWETTKTTDENTDRADLSMIHTD